MTMTDTIPSRRNVPMETRALLDTAQEGRPLSVEETLHLLELSNSEDLRRLREAADALRREQTGGNTFFYRNSDSIYLTRRCELRPVLYAYFNPVEGAAASLTIDDIDARLEGLRTDRRRRLYVSLGGYDPGLSIAGLSVELSEKFPLKTLARLLNYLREHAPENMLLAGFSPDEIDFLSVISEKNPRYVLELLMDHGLAELGGHGTEILSDAVRRRIAEKKAPVSRWLEIAAIAHRIGLPAVAAIEMGPLENLRQRSIHLERLRSFASEHPGAFSMLAVRMWLHSPAPTEAALPACRAVDRFKMTAVARLLLGSLIPDQTICWSLETRRAEAEEALTWGANSPGDTEMMDYLAFLSGGNAKGAPTAEEFRDMIGSVGGIIRI